MIAVETLSSWGSGAAWSAKSGTVVEGKSVVFLEHCFLLTPHWHPALTQHENTSSLTGTALNGQRTESSHGWTYDITCIK